MKIKYIVLCLNLDLILTTEIRAFDSFLFIAFSHNAVSNYLTSDPCVFIGCLCWGYSQQQQEKQETGLMGCL